MMALVLNLEPKRRLRSLIHASKCMQDLTILLSSG